MSARSQEDAVETTALLLELYLLNKERDGLEQKLGKLNGQIAELELSIQQRKDQERHIDDVHRLRDVEPLIRQLAPYRDSVHAYTQQLQRRLDNAKSLPGVPATQPAYFPDGCMGTLLKTKRECAELEQFCRQRLLSRIARLSDAGVCSGQASGSQ